MDVKVITDALRFTRNYWSAIENARKILSVEKLPAVLELLEFDEDEQRELLALREVAKQRGWWAPYSALFSEEVFRFFGLEHGAQSIRTYESLLIPGLLQSERYARALITADVTVRQVEVDQRVEVRLRRQERLRGDDTVQLTAIISQAALMQQIGGREVLHDQLQHLARTIESHPKAVQVRVVPFTATGCGLFGASTFSLLDFGNPRLPTLAYQETVTTVGILDDSNKLRDLSRTYTEALGGTLTVRDSLELIRQCARETA